MFDDRGNYVATYGDPGSGKFKLRDPIDVAVGADGRSYVLDKTQKKIVMYDANRRPVKEQTFEDWPAVAHDGAEQPPVRDHAPRCRRLQRGPRRRPITGYLAAGKKPGQFDKPGAVAVD